MKDITKSGSIEILLDEIENSGKHVTTLNLMLALPFVINTLEGFEKQVFVLYYMKQSNIETIIELTGLDEDVSIEETTGETTLDDVTKKVIETLDVVTKKVIDML